MRNKVSKYIPVIVCASVTLGAVIKGIDILPAFIYGVIFAGVISICDCFVYMVDDVKKMFKRPNYHPILIDCEEEK